MSNTSPTWLSEGMPPEANLSVCFGRSHLITMTMASMLGGQYATKITHFQGVPQTPPPMMEYHEPRAYSPKLWGGVFGEGL